MELERKKTLLIKAGCYLLYAFAIYVALRYLWLLLLPFLLGFAVAYMLRPATRFICRHSKMSRRWASIICAIVFYLLAGLLCWIISAFFLLELEEIAAGLPQIYTSKIEPALSLLNEKLIRMAGRFFPRMDGGQVYKSVNEALGGVFISASTWVLSLVTNMAKALPMAILTLIFTVVSSVLVCADYEGVTGFVMRQIPQRLHSTILDVRDFLARSIIKILKTYIILMFITFAMLALGLWFLQVDGFVLYAVIIAFLDLLPILGSGIVLIPWGTLLIVMGDNFTGIGMLLLWAVISVIREVLEPRILGGQIGLHPLATLTAMYLGLKLAGLAGLILAPVCCLLACYLQDNGIIKLYNSDDKNTNMK